MKAPSTFPPALGRRPSIEWVPPAELEIDAAYQRSIEYAAARRQIRRIADAWDWSLFGMLMVSRRPDDRLFVIDGQHRLEAAKLRGDIDSLPCSISRRAGPDEEARLFIAANRTRRSVATLDDYHAALAAGDPDTVQLNRMIEAAGLKMARHASAKGYGQNELGYVAGLRRAIEKHGAPPVASALSLMGEAFPDETFVNGGAILSALIDLRANHQLDHDQLFNTLLERTTAEWSQAAQLGALKGGTQRATAVKNAVMARYRTRSAQSRAAA